jgi:Mce-associated membrane protein
VSDSNRAPRRRRIAGEPGPAAPAAKQAPVRRPPLRKPVVAKAPGKDAPVQAGPVRQAPVKQPSGPRSAAPAAVPTRTPTVREAREPRAPGSRPTRRDLLWLVPATLVAIAALVVGVLLVVHPPGGGSSSGGSLDSSRRQASASAASAAETIFSFRYDQLDDHLATSKALMTPEFSGEFDKIAPALTELAPQRKIVVQAVARESAAMPCGSSCSATKADVLVFVDQARLVGDSKQPTVFANRIKVSMVKGDDGWLVDDIRAL